VNRSPALFIFTAFFLGLIIGAVGFAFFLRGHVATNFELHNLSYLASLEEKTDSAYRHEQPQVAAWALTRLIELQRSLREQAKPGQTVQLSQDLMVSYARLALTYQKMGRDDLYHQNITQALKLAKEVMPTVIGSEQELLDYIHSLDRTQP
jgi:isoleucyl-tRNA synthetase